VPPVGVPAAPVRRVVVAVLPAVALPEVLAAALVVDPQAALVVAPNRPETFTTPLGGCKVRPTTVGV
jgi:hypothetical protein